MKNLKISIILAAALLGCDSPKPANSIAEVTQKFLDDYTTQSLKLHYESSKAHWASNIQIIEGDTTNAYRTQQADEAKAKFSGSVENIENVKKFLASSHVLSDLQVRQLKAILYKAADNPQTVADLVIERIKAETEQTEKLYGFDFQMDGKSVSTNDLDEALKNNDVGIRRKAWEASKEVGKNLKEGLINLRRLRNHTVGALDYNDYFTYQVSEYDMSTNEMTELCDQLIADVWPLYRQLHTYMRYFLADKYDEEVPEMLPAHWLPNRWGQDWSAEIEVEGIDLDGILEEKGATWLVEQSERFYVSMGFPELPKSFYTKSSLYPLPDSVDYKKNNHASAWHLDLKNDVRSLMSVISNSEWYETTHHELGHIYYYIAYTNPKVPPLLRAGANRAFHEAIGSQMGLASMQKPFLAQLGLIDENIETDEMAILLKEAMNYIVFIPWSAGVMTQFEKSLYTDNLSQDEFNKKWWELKAKYQGIIPPSDRGEEFCDAASKTHINNDAAQYYDYALSYAILFQLHNHVATNILKQDPRATNYYGSREIGDFMKQILSKGNTVDWRELMMETTGEEINAKAMISYFEPLVDYLKRENQGRIHTLPEKF